VVSVFVSKSVVGYNLGVVLGKWRGSKREAEMFAAI
jgi:hypothetical protein